MNNPADQDLEQSLFGYNGTAGFVNRPASEERARREASNGAISDRAKLFLSMLLGSHEKGMTWKEIQQLEPDLHHGQISSVLSNLHKAGHVFQLVEHRDGCHPYCHHTQRYHFAEHEMYLSPTTTKAGQRLKLLTDIYEWADVAESFGYENRNTLQLLTEAIQKLRQFEKDNK